LNKAAVELSINFMVMFILAIIMFSIGVVIVREIFTEADDAKKRLTEQQKEQLRQIMFQGKEQVKLDYTKKELRPNEYEVFGIAIRNDLSSATNFFIDADCDTVILIGGFQECDDGGALGLPECGAEYDQWLTIDDDHTGGPYNISSNDIYVQDIFVFVPKDADKGTYVYNVKVCKNAICDNTNQYSVTKQLNVVVK